MSKNKYPVKEDIQQVTANGNKHRNKRVSQSFQELFEETE